VAHFDSMASNLESDSKFLHSLNRILPNDIAIHQIKKVKPDANARFDATLRGYEYVICRKKDPFWIGLAWFYDAQLNIENMQLAAQQLINYTDFTSFSKVGSETKTNNCHIYNAEWKENGNLLIFTIEANRFLRNMVRAIVGTLIDVGRGKITPEEFAQIIEKRDRKLAGTSAPAEGLYLTRIEYPDECFFKINYLQGWCSSLSKSLTVFTGENVANGTSTKMVFQLLIAPFQSPGSSNALSCLPSLLLMDIKPV